MKSENKKQLKLKYGLKDNELKLWLNSLSLENASIFNSQIHNLLWSFIGNISLELIDSIWNEFEFLDSICEKSIIYSRFDIIESFDKSRFGIHLSEFFPELKKIQTELHEKLDNESSGILRAELFLLPVALDSGADSSTEALVYFASKGRLLLTAKEITKRWHQIICYDIQRGSIFKVIPEKIKERAKDNLIPLSEAAEILIYNGELPRFFGFRDEEEDFIDVSFLRTIEWLNVEGFDNWVKSTINNILTSTQYGIEHNKFSWFLFFCVRSNTLLKKANKVGLESLLWGLINGPFEKDKPWLTFWDSSSKDKSLSTYIPIASCIIFAWYRINPTGINREIIDNATAVLYSNQLSNGSWPIVSCENEGHIISTCFAVHALCIHKPLGWEKSCEKAVIWLKEQQNRGGFWFVQGGPTIMITTLVLDAINYYEGNTTTFNHEMKPSNEPEEKERVDFSKEIWFKKPIPKIKSESKKNGIKSYKPKIALVCAVEVELKYILKELIPPDGKENIIKIVDGTETYYIGQFGCFLSVVTMSSMGTQGATGSILSIDSIIRVWNPIVVVMPGIAFGADITKQKAGHVLIANSIIPYEIQKISNGKISYRNPVPATSDALINRVRNAFAWEFKLPDGTLISKHIGAILSGEKLINDKKFKDELLSEYPNAIGGEMESSGVWSSASKHSKQWIIIKSVCDWADGIKNDEYQELAAATSVSLCKFIFDDSFALDGIK